VSPNELYSSGSTILLYFYHGVEVGAGKWLRKNLGFLGFLKKPEKSEI